MSTIKAGPGIFQAAMAKKKKEAQQAAVTQKGVGGFRPVVDWSQLSLKKKLADKQVLICILISGTIIIAVGCILLFLGLFVINRQCPFNWLNFIDDTCLYVSEHNVSWPSSRDFCTDQGGNLVDVADINENDKVKERLKGPTWIALFRPRESQQFEWASGSSNSYRNWASSPSGAAPKFSQCVRMNHESGRWHVDDDCNQKYFAACEYKKSYYPLVLIGPIIMICGVIVLILSIEICQRLRKSKSLIENEELPEEDSEYVKKTMTPEHDLAPSWRNNKTSPLAATPSPRSNLVPPTTTSNHAWASQSSSSSSSQKSSSETPKKLKRPSRRKKNSSQSDLLIGDDHSKSQEQLELLLTPKSLI